MSSTISDDDIQQLAGTAKPYTLALLWWGPERHRAGAEAIELEHQRRMVGLRADGVIAVLCPGQSDTLAAVAVMTVTPDEGREIMAGDPCVQADMIRCDVYPGVGFPGDSLPG